jgi:hypothetical protein
MDTTGGTPSFDQVTAGTNTNALVVGTGGTFTASGSGSIIATRVDAVGAAPILFGSADVTEITINSDGLSSTIVEAELDIISDGAIDLASEVSGLLPENNLAASLAFDDGDLLSFAAGSITTAIEGILLPGHATSCASATGEGQICVDRDDDSASLLWIGDGNITGGGMTNWNIDGDNASPQTVGDGETATVAGTAPISTSAAATRTVTVSLDGDGVNATHIDETADYTFTTLSGKQDRNNTAVNDDDCTGEQGLWWYDTTDSQFEVCNANSGTPIAITAAGGGDITAVGDCETSDCFTGASGTTLSSNTDIILDLDEDNNGTESFQILDGADATVAEVTEAGLLTITEVRGISTDLTISTTAGNDVLIGDDSTLLFIDGGLDNVAVGAAANPAKFSVLGSHTSADPVIGTELDADLTTAATGQGHQVAIANDRGSFTTPAASTISLLTSLFVEEPGITLGGGGATVTDSASLFIKRQATEATNNYSLWIDAGPFRLDGVQYIQEQADADADIAGFGQLWVNTATPNELWFTDDAGTDVQLGVGGTVADLNDITNVTLTTPGDGSVLCFTGTANASNDCTVGGDLTATEDTGTITYAVTDDSHNHVITNIDAFTAAQLQTQTSDVTTFYTEDTVVPVADGGTGLSSGTDGGILGFTATGTLASSALRWQHHSRWRCRCYANICCCWCDN